MLSKTDTQEPSSEKEKWSTAKYMWDRVVSYFHVSGDCGRVPEVEKNVLEGQLHHLTFMARAARWRPPMDIHHENLI